jgi:hypothetical protein
LHVRHTFFKYQFNTKFPNASLNGGVAAAVSVVRMDVMLDVKNKITLVFPLYEDMESGCKTSRILNFGIRWK